jgi:ariadne-1
MQDIQQEQAMTWIEVQFMKQAVDTIVTCRKTLQWTYAFAFYLKRCNMTQIFEDNQKDLEYATECLSELVEKPLEDVDLNELKRQIQDKAYYVSNRRDILLQDTAQGLLENRWEFNF